MPSSELIHGLSNWVIFLLKFFNRWWWRRHIIQKGLENDYIHTKQNPLHHLPTPFPDPSGKKNNQNKQPFQKKTSKKKTNQAFQPPPQPKKTKKLNTQFSPKSTSSGWLKFRVGSFPHASVDDFPGLWGWPIPCGPHHWKEGTPA